VPIEPSRAAVGCWHPGAVYEEHVRALRLGDLAVTLPSSRRFAYVAGDVIAPPARRHIRPGGRSPAAICSGMVDAPSPCGSALESQLSHLQPIGTANSSCGRARLNADG